MAHPSRSKPALLWLEGEDHEILGFYNEDGILCGIGTAVSCVIELDGEEVSYTFYFPPTIH